MFSNNFDEDCFCESALMDAHAVKGLPDRNHDSPSEMSIDRPVASVDVEVI